MDYYTAYHLYYELYNNHASIYLGREAVMLLASMVPDAEGLLITVSVRNEVDARATCLHGTALVVRLQYALTGSLWLHRLNIAEP